MSTQLQEIDVTDQDKANLYRHQVKTFCLVERPDVVR